MFVGYSGEPVHVDAGEVDMTPVAMSRKVFHITGGVDGQSPGLHRVGEDPHQYRVCATDRRRPLPLADELCDPGFYLDRGDVGDAPVRPHGVDVRPPG